MPINAAVTTEVSKVIRVIREHHKSTQIHYVKSLGLEGFSEILKGTACLVGNSSAGIKESSYLGIPVVNIGTRQQGRLRAENVLDVGYNKEEITAAIQKQLANGKYPQSYIYHKENTAKQSADILTSVDLDTHKSFVD